MSNIVTGQKQYSLKNAEAKEGKSYSVLFDSESVKSVSHFIHLGQGKALKFSTFNLPDGVHLAFHRVLPGGGSMPQGAGCLCDTQDGNTTYALASEPFKIDCKPVVLDNCNGVLFLTIPGVYMLELSDESALGQVLAFAEEVSCSCIPDGLIIGNAKPDTYVGTKLG